MKLISPSKLAIIGASHNETGHPFAPIGIPAKAAGSCLMCGFTHEEGELVVDPKMSDTFTNWSDLNQSNASAICGYCAAVSQDPWTQAWMNSVITEKGVYKFASNNDIAHWLLDPPKSPFVMIFGDQQKQHLVWRTPVNYSSEVFQVRIGEKVVTIRSKQLIAARDAAHALSGLLNKRMDEGKTKRGAKAANSFITPYIRPIREMDDFLAGRLKDTVVQMSEEDPVAKEHVKTLNKCTPGEIWALTAVLYATPIESSTRHILKTKTNALI